MASEKEADGLKFIKIPKAPQSGLYFPQTVSKNLCSTSYTECLKLIHFENLLHSGTILGSFYTHSQHQHQPWDLGWADSFVVKNIGLERERKLLWVISEEGPSGEQQKAQYLNLGLLHSNLYSRHEPLRTGRSENYEGKRDARYQLSPAPHLPMDPLFLLMGMRKGKIFRPGTLLVAQ